MTAPAITAAVQRRRDSHQRLINLLVDAERRAGDSQASFDRAPAEIRVARSVLLAHAKGYAEGVLDALRALDG